VELTFASSKLQALCKSGRELRRRHGQPCAKKVAARLADLNAAQKLDDLRDLPGRCHELKGERRGQLALDLGGGKRLIIRPLEDPPPAKNDGGLDWTLVESIEVVEITDYH
jgi:toxin HigB-1